MKIDPRLIAALITEDLDEVREPRCTSCGKTDEDNMMFCGSCENSICYSCAGQPTSMQAWNNRHSGNPVPMQSGWMYSKRGDSFCPECQQTDESEPEIDYRDKHGYGYF
jgi:hypothetical protein